jgi:hypothetical protein
MDRNFCSVTCKVQRSSICTSPLISWSFFNYQLLQQKLPEEEGDCAPASTLSQDLTIPKVRDLHHMVDIIMQINAL